MPQVVITLVKALGMFFVKKMLLKLSLDLVEEALEKGVAKTEYKWDDKLSDEFKKHRGEIEHLINNAL